MTDPEGSSEVELESGPTASVPAELDEPFKMDPAVGVKTALSCALDAANDVEQATVALWPLGVTAMFAQPLIATPPFSNVTPPHRAVLLVPAVTVAIRVTVWLATGEDGVTSTLIVVDCDTTGSAATTLPA